MIIDIPFLFFAKSLSPMWYWEHCDEAAKVVVVLLAILSVASLSTIVSRIGTLKKAKKENSSYEQSLSRFGKLSLAPIPEETSTTPPYAKVLRAALVALLKHRGKIKDEADVRVCMSHVENAIQRMIARVTTGIYEKGLVKLSTFVSAGPFLGLLGTVWGVMVTFGNLTEKATISELAPGVSGALVATTFGLLLAIPASFAYNYLLGRVREMTTELDNFASLIADEIETELLESLRDKNASEAQPAPTPKNDNPFLSDEYSRANAGSLDQSRPSWN